MRGVFSGMSLMLQHKEAQWQCCQKGEWVTVTPHPSTQRFWHLFNMLRTKFNSKDQQLQNMYVHTHTHTQVHTLKPTVGLTRFCRFAGGAPGFSGLGCSDTNSLTARGRTRLTDIKLKLDGQLLQCTALTLMLHPLL